MRLRRFKEGSFLALALLVLSVPKEGQAYFGQTSVGLLGSMYRPDLDNEKTKSGRLPIFPFYRSFFAKKPGAANGPITPFMGMELDLAFAG